MILQDEQDARKPAVRYPTSRMKHAALGLACIAPLLLGQQDTREWPIYGGGPENIRYSKLSQINRDNVTKLAVAWTFNTGDDFKGSEMQCNPIVVNGVLYATTPKLRVFALD